jgi:acyl-CoA thioesterase-1
VSDDTTEGHGTISSMISRRAVWYGVSVLGVCIFFILFFIMRNTSEDTEVSTIPTKALDNDSSNASYTIIAFGDSLTAGYGVSLEESYPAMLERALRERNLEVRVVNMGVSGEVTTAGVERVDFILSQKPSLVLLGLGANDMLRASSPQIARTNIETIVRRLTDAQVPIILLGMKSVASNGDTYREEFDPIYPSLAQKYRIPLVPFFLEGVALNPELNTRDGIHPNALGYEKIVRENILPILLPVLEGILHESQ